MEKARRAETREPKELTGNKALAKEMVDGVVELVSAGFDEHKVLKVWSYSKFRMMVKAVRRQGMERRSEFVLDVAYSVAGIIGGGKGKSPLDEHLKLMATHIREYLDG